MILRLAIALWDADLWLRFYALTGVPENWHGEHNLLLEDDADKYLKVKALSAENSHKLSNYSNCF